MKHLIVLISMILTPLLSISQQYQPIPDSNASWIVRQDDGYGGLMWHKFFLTGDTLINSTKYTKVFFRFDIADPEYCGAFRNGENGKSRNKHGKNGKDVIIEVPVGTLVIDRETEKIIADRISNVEVVLGHQSPVVMVDMMPSMMEYLGEDPGEVDGISFFKEISKR